MKRLVDVAWLITQNKRDISDRFELTAIGIFGSYARQQQTNRSDLDVLVNYEKLLMNPEFLELRDLLSEVTGLDVDLLA